MKTVLMFALPLLLLAAPAVAQNAASVDELVRQGIENYGLENYKTAYAQFSQAMKIDPNHPEASKWFWKMKAEHDVKNLQDKGSPAGGPGGTVTGGSAAATGEGVGGVRYVYSETEQQALLGHLESLDERLSLLSQEIRNDSSVDKAEMDERLLAISRDLSALSAGLSAIDVREDLERQLSAIARDLETLKDRDVGPLLDQKLASLSEDIRRLGSSNDREADLAGISAQMTTLLAEVRGIDVDRHLDTSLTSLSRGLEQKLAALNERIQVLDDTNDNLNLEAQLASIGTELGRLAEEQARAAGGAERDSAVSLMMKNPLFLALLGCVVVAVAFLILLLVWRARYQRLKALSPLAPRPTTAASPGMRMDDMLATADNPSFAPSRRPARDWPNLSEVPAGQRENVISQLTEMVARDEDLRRRLARTLDPSRSPGAGTSTPAARKPRRERAS